MNRIQYFFKRLVKMDYKAMWKTTALLQKRSGKSRIWLLIDMLRCAVKYNAGYVDYKIAKMYKLNDKQRKTVITRGISNNIVRRMNDKDYWHSFDDKAAFNTLFSDYVKRDWLMIDSTLSSDTLDAFLKNKTQIIAKPIEGSSGQGIERFERSDWEGDIPMFLERLWQNDIGIIEEVIQQHEELNALCPTSVNTIRIATLLGDKAQGIVYAFLRIGNGRVVDNVDCGGMAARVDLASGTLLTVGADKQGNTYAEHPQTGTAIIGFTIPFWEEAKQICLEAAQKVPQMRFIAWDVAITPTGPVFIEGNSFPSHAIPQFADHYPDGIGILPEFEHFITL